ncbi:protein YLS7 [Ricinus communis]|uniref:protein YLS7 n=1 Tax=Ricinus communis TaxID=3988 RepID=UPI000772B58E|nr:protein YLS7 [Ricinus communis]XP_015581137.1 protein YLS7 [Ricinus communis]|eukprot:XP_015581134.1 protein YLS7 [Ricinus communis]
MTLDSPKGVLGFVAFPRSLSSMAVSVGGLAIFLILASLLLVSYPIGSTVHGYFYGVDNSSNDKLVLPVFPDNTKNILDSNEDLISKNSPSGSSLEVPISSSGVNDSVEVSDKNSEPNLQLKEQAEEKSSSVASGAKENALSDTSGIVDKELEENIPVIASPDSKSEANSLISDVSSNVTKTTSDDSDCDLYHGSWFYDSLGPLYTNNTCPVLTQMQNCQGNGRPDKEYENWRWKPSQCELPRFDAKKFLELMRGKTLAFIGDSVARNQMESMLCLLWQVEVPKNRGNKRMQRYFFRSTSTMIVRIWSSWLVHKSSEPIDFAPEGVVKLHLDAPDEDFMEYIRNFDVIVLSSGHWFAKQSVYVLNNEIVGGQLWWPDKSHPMKINNVEAFGISTETILTSIVTHPNYTGLTILRSYSPDHYEGGAWNTGGSCTGKVKPLAPGELVENGFTEIMHAKQVTAFDRAFKKATNKSKLRLLDITEPFGYRHDGHPGPYRSPDPNKITKRGPDGRPPPQDCLHWCMPGPVDTWNEFVLETIRREFETKESSSS